MLVSNKILDLLNVIFCKLLINICLLARNKNELLDRNNDSSSAEKSKKGKAKEKLRKLKKVVKKDADKDVDETEVKLKHHNKRKWF